MECRAGEVHAVVGENGSGKSTLLGIASGFSRPTRAWSRSAGSACTLPGRRGASPGTGDGLPEPRPGADPERGREPLPRGSHRRAAPLSRDGSWAADKLRQFDVRVSPGAQMASLALGERQFLEVVKALLVSRRCCCSTSRPLRSRRWKWSVSISSSSALRPRGRYRLRQPPAAGGARDRSPGDGATGRRYQGTHATSEMWEQRLVALMIGRSLKLAFPSQRETSGGRRCCWRSTGSAAADSVRSI